MQYKEVPQSVDNQLDLLKYALKQASINPTDRFMNLAKDLVEIQQKGYSDIIDPILDTCRDYNTVKCKDKYITLSKVYSQLKLDAVPAIHLRKRREYPKVGNTVKIHKGNDTPINDTECTLYKQGDLISAYRHVGIYVFIGTVHCLSGYDIYIIQQVYDDKFNYTENGRYILEEQANLEPALLFVERKLKRHTKLYEKYSSMEDKQIIDSIMEFLYCIESGELQNV